MSNTCTCVDWSTRWADAVAECYQHFLQERVFLRKNVLWGRKWRNRFCVVKKVFLHSHLFMGFLVVLCTHPLLRSSSVYHWWFHPNIDKLFFRIRNREPVKLENRKTQRIYVIKCILTTPLFISTINNGVPRTLFVALSSDLTMDQKTSHNPPITCWRDTSASIHSYKTQFNIQNS